MKNSDRPSFPNEIDYAKADIGLTKREYFAGLAMQGILSNTFIMDIAYKVHKDGTPLDKHVTAMSLEYADELLKQLEE